MEKKNQHTTSNVPQKSNQKNTKGTAVNTDTNIGATNKVKPRSGSSLANEGTNVSYDEER